MYTHVSRILHLLLFVIGVGACGSSVYFIHADAGMAPAAALASTPVPVLPRALDAIPDSRWSLVQPGLEWRVIEVYNRQNQHVESLHVWRLDQNYFRLDVAYDERPKSLETWQRETDAALVLNGGFYSIDNERYFPDGLTIRNGRASGRSFSGHGGMLAIDQYGAEVRWLVEKPYNPSEQFQAGLQSFPILVKPGGVLGFGAERESHVSARRTVIAQDRDGRILFMVAPRGYFTLHQLSVYLTESDLNLDVALNLDGGGSTGILVADPREVISPTRLLPFVILAYARYE